MNFSDALALMTTGRKVQRVGWNGNGMFAFTISPDPIRVTADNTFAIGQPLGTPITVRSHFMLFTAQKDFAHWVPSSSDLLATDWQEVK